MPARIKLSIHAQIRLRERGIDAGSVKNTVLSPDFTDDAYDGKMLVRKEMPDGRTLEVIYYREDFRNTNDYLIITAYYI